MSEPGWQMKPHYSPILGLAYISLFAGSTLGHLTESEFWIIAGTPVILVGVAIMMVGMVRYDASKHNIGNSSEAFIKSVIDGSN